MREDEESFDPADVPPWAKWAIVDSAAASAQRLCSMLGIPEQTADEVAMALTLETAALLEFSQWDML